MPLASLARDKMLLEMPLTPDRGLAREGKALLLLVRLASMKRKRCEPLWLVLAVANANPPTPHPFEAPLGDISLPYTLNGIVRGGAQLHCSLPVGTFAARSCNCVAVAASSPRTNCTSMLTSNEGGSKVKKMGD